MVSFTQAQGQGPVASLDPEVQQPLRELRARSESRSADLTPTEVRTRLREALAKTPSGADMPAVNGTMIPAAVLIYPITDHRMATGSYRTHGTVVSPWSATSPTRRDLSMAGHDF